MAAPGAVLAEICSEIFFGVHHSVTTSFIGLVFAFVFLEETVYKYRIDEFEQSCYWHNVYMFSTHGYYLEKFAYLKA